MLMFFLFICYYYLCHVYAPLCVVIRDRWLRRLMVVLVLCGRYRSVLQALEDSDIEPVVLKHG